MNPHIALQLASRLHPLLLQQLDHGIDTHRMVTDALYARDVLLVCDAHRGSELAELAQQFRQAMGPQPAAGQRQGSRHSAAAAGWQPPRPAGVPLSPDDPGHDGQARHPHSRHGAQPAGAPPDQATAGDRSADGHGAAAGAARFLGSLFGPAAPMDKAAARGQRPQRGWFGRWRDTGL